VLKQQVLQQQQQKKNKKGLLCINLRGKKCQNTKTSGPNNEKEYYSFWNEI